MANVRVVKSDSHLGFARLILEVTPGFSVGVILDKQQLINLQYEIKDVLDLNTDAILSAAATNEIPHN